MSGSNCPSRAKGILAAGLLAAGLGLPLQAQEASFVFRLLPSSAWPPTDAGAEALPSGTVFLYREGSHTPELVLEANRPQTVPPGTWVWSAEAEAYVSVVAGTLQVPPDIDQDAPKTLLWPVVPACRMVLARDAEWSGVHRLDAVSATSDAVYPVDPDRRRELWVPAGRLLVYGVGPRGLQGIDDLGECSQGQVVEVEPPAPPDRDHQEFLVSALLPERVVDQGRDDLSIRVEGSGRRRPAPTAEVWVGNRVSALFLDVPALRDGEVTFHHPELRTRRVPLEALGGSARELPDQRLRQRLDLTVEVDYQPLRRHRRAELRIHYCGGSARLDLRSLRNCELLDQRPMLQEGLHPYTFEALDDGRYYLEAWIDDFMVPGLGAFVRPHIDPESEHPPQLDRALLHELEVHGSVLLDGEPVPGTVSLLAMYEKHRRLADHHFPTGDDGRYRLFYFGRLPGQYEKPPGFEDSSDRRDLLGIYGDYQLVACSTDGFCRPFSLHSVLQGEGRLDLELGNGVRVEVRVTDASTGKPIPDALVSIAAPETALYFHHGTTDWFEPLGTEGAYRRTDGAGVARVLAHAQDGSVFLIVHHEGYRRVRRQFPVLSEETNRIDVALEPQDEDAGDHRFVFDDGSPVAGGFLLVMEPGSGVDARCSTATSRRGFADLPDECLFGRVVVLVAPGTRIETFGGTSLASFGEVRVSRAPSRPLRIRLVDEDGRPIRGVPVQLRYPDVVLGPNHFLMAATATGYQAFYLTDEDGEIALRGVDPEAVTVPDLGLALGDEVRWESLAGYSAGETAILTVEE